VCDKDLDLLPSGKHPSLKQTYNHKLPPLLQKFASIIYIMSSTPPCGFVLLVIYNHMCEYTHGVAMIGRLLKIIGLFCRISSFL